MNKLIFTLLFSILFACDKRPDVDIETTSKIYVDLLVVEETHRGLPDSLKKYKAIVFERYNSTEAEYMNSFMLMKNDQKIWNDLFESSIAYLDSLKAEGTNVKVDSSQVRL